MGKPRALVSDNPSKGRVGSWKKIFETLVNTIEDQQRQLESLNEERRSLEKRFQSLKDRWGFDVKLLEDHIQQLTRDSKLKAMGLFVEKAKANLIISMKQKKAIINKLKFEEADDARVDLKLVIEELSRLLAEPKRVTRSSAKDVAESSLKAERDFAWNQYQKTDKKLKEVIKRTELEVKGANEKLQKLISDLEQSEALNMEKDRKISSLHDDIVVLELDSRKKTEEISRLTKELELLKGNSNHSVMPALRRCMAGSSKNSHSSGMKLRGDSNHSVTPILRRCTAVASKSTCSGGLAIIEKGGRSSKRKAIESEPRLFTSKFKVPRLKA